MALTYKILASGYSASTSVTNFNTIYTVPSGKQAIIKHMTFSNKSATDQAYEIRIVPSGVTSGAQHTFVAEGTTGPLRQAGAGPTVRYEQVITLNAGDFIQLANTSANAVGFLIFGVEIS
jgi:hypothetical protein